MQSRGSHLVVGSGDRSCGKRFPGKFGRIGFRRNFAFGGMWRGRSYAMKQLEVFAVEEDGSWVVITVITRFF